MINFNELIYLKLVGYSYLIINYTLVFALGCIYAFAELIGRYSEPSLILKIRTGQLYLVFNGLISCFALLIVMEFDVDFLHYKKIEGGKILIAGTSAMIVLRSSIASVKVGGKNVEGSLYPIIQVFLDAVNKAYDRERSKVDLKKIKLIMDNVDYLKAENDLPTVCMNILQTLSQAEVDKMTKELSVLSATKADKKTKAMNLGIILARYTGMDLLEKAVDSIRETIQTEQTTQNGDATDPSIDDLIIKFSS